MEKVYLIRRSDGLLLGDIESECWTDNPTRAWKFKYKTVYEQAEGIIREEFAMSMERHLFFGDRFTVPQIQEQVWEKNPWQTTAQELMDCIERDDVSVIQVEIREGMTPGKVEAHQNILLHNDHGYCLITNSVMKDNMDIVLAEGVIVDTCIVTDCSGMRLTFISNLLFDDPKIPDITHP